MKQVCRFLFAITFLTPLTLMAQKEEKVEGKNLKEKKGSETIVITRNTDSQDKMVIEVDGEKITVNGKPLDEFKNENITVSRHNIKDVWAYADGLKGMGNFNSFPGQGNNAFFRTDSNRAFLGVTTEKSEKGVRVISVSKESAAAKAGLREDDIINKVGDKKVETPDDLSAAIKKQKPGDKVVVGFHRDGKDQTASAELGKYKGTSVYSPAEGFNFDFGDINLEQMLPRSPSAPRIVTGYNNNAPKLGLSVQDTDDGKGVKILDVSDESTAEKAGLKEEDIITEIDGKAVNSADEVAKIIRESKTKASVMVKLQRAGKTQNVEVKIPKKLKTANL